MKLHRSLRRIAVGIVAALIAIFAVASLLTVLRTNLWWIRVMDFVKAELVLILAVLGLGYLLLCRPRRFPAWLPMLVLFAAVAYDVSRFYAYFPFTGEPAVAAAECPAGSRLRVMIANVQMGNRQDDRLFEILRDADPDLFLAMETDEWWSRQLGRLQSRFPYHVRQVHDVHTYFGIELWSKDALVDPEIRFLTDARVPSVFTGVRLPAGDTVSFYGIHPRPPYWSQPSTYRDAELLAAALEAHGSAQPVVIAGDLNAVPWERVLAKARRLGGLLDPRMGRGFYPTFDAKLWFFKWPLDQVLYQRRLVLTGFRVLPAFGSDHDPFLVELCHAPKLAGRQYAPEPAPDDAADAQRAIEAARGSR